MVNKRIKRKAACVCQSTNRKSFSNKKGAKFTDCTCRIASKGVKLRNITIWKRGPRYPS